jgi:hypothetical protein
MNQIILAPGIKGNKRRFAAHIINGDYQALRDMEKTLNNSKIPDSWFSEKFDTQENKLVAFAIRVALQKGTEAHKKIAEHLVIKAKAEGINPFTTTKNKYTLVHVIGNYSQSNENGIKYAKEMMNMLHRHDPNRLQKALKATYKGTAKTPRSHTRAGRGFNGQAIAQVFNTYHKPNARTRTTTAASVNNAQMKALQKEINKLKIQVRLQSQGQSQNYTRGGTNRGGKRVKPQPTWVPGPGNVPVSGVTWAPPATQGRKIVRAKKRTR